MALETGATKTFRQQTEILGDAFDEVVLYPQDQCQRGRADGEVLMLQLGLKNAKRTVDIKEILANYWLSTLPHEPQNRGFVPDSPSIRLRKRWRTLLCA